MEQSIVHELLNAANNRHSIRNFLPDALSEETLAQVDDFIKTVDLPFSHQTEFVRFKAEPGKKLYNNGINAPDNLAILAPTDLVSVSKAGFFGQLVILKLTALGINTAGLDITNCRNLPDISEQISLPRNGSKRLHGVWVTDTAKSLMPVYARFAVWPAEKLIQMPNDWLIRWHRKTALVVSR